MTAVSLASCGGEPAKTDSSAGKSPAAGSGDAGAANEAPNAEQADGGSKAEGAQAEQPQDKKPKRVRRPRINMPVVKALLANEPLSPKPQVASTPELVALGKALYHEEHLSAKGNQSCATCHDLRNYGVDNETVSKGSLGEAGTRNTPSTYNASRQFAQFWDSRAKSVEEQAVAQVKSPTAHGLADDAAVVAKIKEKEALVAAFTKAFPGQEDPVTADNFGVAIGAFERTLVTKSRWDKFLDGDRKALTNEELQGLKVFMDVNCTQCHMTRLLGGSMNQKLGVYRKYDGEDVGRMAISGNEAEKYMFKVPSLLNVEKTAPYYHDGSIATLEQAVREMGTNQLDKELTDEQVASIITFLQALTGELPEEFAKK